MSGCGYVGAHCSIVTAARESAMQSRITRTLGIASKSALIAAGVEVRMSKSGLNLCPAPNSICQAGETDMRKAFSGADISRLWQGGCAPPVTLRVTPPEDIARKKSGRACPMTPGERLYLYDTPLAHGQQTAGRAILDR